MIGFVTVFIESGEIQSKTKDMFGSIDPYITFKIGSQDFITTVQKGKKPVWN